ncbi:MAG: tetratricopeptide repeat protein [Holophagales bacterium]|nr:tetratricopeptide repeat protein [Holophagales bacterium]
MSRSGRAARGIRTLAWASALAWGSLVACAAGADEYAEPPGGGSPETPRTAESLRQLLDRAEDVARRDPEGSREIALAALDGARSLELGAAEAEALNRVAVASIYLGDYSAAFEKLTESLRVAELANDLDGVANALNNLGIVYYYWGAWDRALDHYQQTLERRQAANDLEGVAAAYNNLGNVSEAAERYAEALEFYGQSLRLYRQLAEPAWEASTHNNIGLTHLRLGDLEIAREHFRQAHEIATETGDALALAFAESHLGLVYQQEKDFDRAQAAHQRSLELRQEIGDRQGVAISRHNLASLWADRGEGVRAIRELEAALALASDLDIPQLIRDSHLELSEVRAGLGDFQGALRDYQASKEADERLFSEASQRRLAEVRAHFELDKKDRQIEQLESRRATQRLVRLVLVVVSLLLFAIVVLLLSRFRLKTRAHQEIAIKNRALETAQAELERATRSEVAHLGRVASLGELTAAVAHELNQPLSAILTNAQVAETLLTDPAAPAEEVEGAVGDIVLASRRAWELLRHLRKLARKGEVEPEVLDLRHVLREVEGLLSTESRLQDVDFELEQPDGPVQVAADSIHLQQVILNLVQNGLRAAGQGEVVEPEPAWVRVRTVARGGRAVLEVEDSGNGASDEVLEKMFDPFFTTADEGMGMGLAISRRLIQAHGGQAWVRRSLEGGLVVGFDLPLVS